MNEAGGQIDGERKWQDLLAATTSHMNLSLYLTHTAGAGQGIHRSHPKFHTRLAVCYLALKQDIQTIVSVVRKFHVEPNFRV